MRKKWRERIERAEHDARVSRAGRGPLTAAEVAMAIEMAPTLENRLRDEHSARRELERQVQRLTREVAELHHRLLEHDDPVPVQTPNGLDMVKRLDIYRGVTPWGDRIEPVRAVNRRATTYVTLAPEAAVDDA